MRERKFHYCIFISLLLIVQILISCTSKEEKPKENLTLSKEQTLQQPPAPSDNQSITVNSSPVISPSPTPVIVIEVNGKKLTRDQLDKEVKKTMTAVKDRIPAKNVKDYQQNVRKRIVEGFVSRTLLAEEIERKKITVSNQELTDEINKIKLNLPQGVTIEALMKKNNISKEKMNEDIRFSTQINKLVLASVKGKMKPNDKEIGDFYQKNKEKFNLPESVHARHILIAKSSSDDDKIKKEKKEKAESLRQKLMEGADFADLAAKNSDCPSKQNGGDLGVFARGQMVKPFDDAAFAQKVNDIGPVVETDFGYHIIQVLEHKQAQAMALDEAVKGRIASILEQRKLQETFTNLLKNLQEKATIIANEKF